MAHSRFVVGIDLGTTNSALAYFDTGAGDEATLQPLHDSAGDPAGRGRRAAAAAVVPLSARARTSSPRAASICRGRPAAITASANSPATSAARCRPGSSRRQSRGLSYAGGRSQAGHSPLEGARRMHAASRPSKPARYYLKHLVDAWNYQHRQGRRRPSAGKPGHHPDRAGVVRCGGA